MAVALALMWQSRGPIPLKAAASPTGRLLTTPYLFMYDMMVLVIPVGFLVCVGLVSGFLTRVLPALASRWPDRGLHFDRRADSTLAPRCTWPVWSCRAGRGGGMNRRRTRRGRGVNHCLLFDERRPQRGIRKRAGLVHVAAVRIAALISNRVGVGPRADVQRFIDRRELTGTYRNHVLRLDVVAFCAA